MRIASFLLAGLTALSMPATAQKRRPVPAALTARARHQYGREELNVEFGLAIASTPNGVFNKNIYKPSPHNTGVGAQLLLKYIFPSYSKLRIGLRAGITSLRVHNDARAILLPVNDITVKYANPLLQLGIQAHYDAYLTPRIDFRISPFVGYGYAWSEKTESNSNRITAIPAGNSSGFNAGVDLTVKVKLQSNLALTLSSGYQRSWLRFREGNSGNGYNIGHVPVGVGLSVLF